MGKPQYLSDESYNTQETSFGTFQGISSPRIRLESYDTYPYNDSSSRRVVSDSFLQRSLSSSGTNDSYYTDSYHSSRSIPSSLETQISHETGLYNRICTLPDYFSQILGPTVDETILVGLKLLVNQGFLLPECDAIANNGSSDFSSQTDYTYSTNESTQTFDTEIGHSYETGAIDYNSSNTYAIQLPNVNSPSIESEDSMETYYEEGSIISVESGPLQLSSEPISEKSPSNQSIIPTETISELPVIEEIQNSDVSVETIKEPSVMSIESVMSEPEPEPSNEKINSPEPSVSILTEIPGEEEKITVEYEEPDPPLSVLDQSFIEVPTSEVVIAWNTSVISDDVRSQVFSEKSNALLSKTSSNQNNHEVKLSVINTKDDQPNVDVLINERSKITTQNMSEDSTLNHPTVTEKESRRSRRSSNDLKSVSSRRSRRNSNNSEESKRDPDDFNSSRWSRRDSDGSNSSKRSRRDSNDSGSSYRRSRGGSRNEHRRGSKDEHRKHKSSKNLATEPVDLERAKKPQRSNSPLNSSSTKHSHISAKESKEPRRSSIDKKHSRRELRAKDSIAVQKYHEKVKEQQKQQGMIEEISETDSTISSSSPSRSSFRSSVDSDDDIDEKPLKMDKSCSTASILKSKTSSTDTYSLSCQVISSCDQKNKTCVCRCSCCKCVDKKKPPPKKPCPCVKNRSYLCSSEPQKVNEANNCPCQNSTIEEKLYCDCYTTTSSTGFPSTESLGFLQNGDCCGHSKGAIRYAITKITEYEKFTTFEVMKSTRKVPKFMPKSLEGVFVLKHK